LIAVDLRDANLYGAELPGAVFGSLNGLELSTSGLLWRWLLGGQRAGVRLTIPFDFPSIDIYRRLEMQEQESQLLSGLAKMTKARALDGAELSRAILTLTNLEGAHMEGTYLHDTQLQGANLRNARLAVAHAQRADFFGADLRGADLRWANLTDATLNLAQLEGARLEGTLLAGADLGRAIGVTTEQLAAACLNEKTVRPKDLAGPPMADPHDRQVTADPCSCWRPSTPDDCFDTLPGKLRNLLLRRLPRPSR
jgi:uncharacterized protein YjbI with pentapeptide repeats